MVTGQIVDTITNIKTVKLFGHTDHEDEAAIDAMAGLSPDGAGLRLSVHRVSALR
jgi:ATP-binding cassette subfamily B protein